MSKLTKEQFLKSVAGHHLEVLRDDGLYRHIRLKDPSTIIQSFEIITWPGYLAYVGDMGSYTFTRVKDMFCFFRDPENSLSVNGGYWSEKLVAIDAYDGVNEFSWDRFVENLMDFCETDEQKDWMTSELKYVDEDEYGAVAFYREFDNSNDAGIDLSDFFECRHTVASDRYLWCCYALVWAISKYDEYKSLEAAA